MIALLFEHGADGSLAFGLRIKKIPGGSPGISLIEVGF
jgi:hypothetical protein